MIIEYVPLRQFSERYNEGWRIVPGMTIGHGDKTAIMVAPDWFPSESNQEAGRLSGAVTARRRRAKEAT